MQAAGPATDRKLASARLVIGIDQLEELFALWPPESRACENFVAAVVTLARSGWIWVLATMRSDAYGRFSASPQLMALKGRSGQFDLAAPLPGEIRQMICRPAECAGLSFEVRPLTGENLADVLCDASGRSRNSLPILEFTLDQLYQHRSGDGQMLTFEAYERLGRLEGALGRRAEQVYDSLPGPVRERIPELFRTLIVVDLRSGFLGRRLPLSQAAKSTESSEGIGAFVTARLLVTDGDDGDETTIALAHDALIDSWPRLRRWLDEAVEGLRARSRVTAQADWWDAEGRPPELLLKHGPALREAEDLLDTCASDFDRVTQDFVRVSTHRQKESGRSFLWGLILVAAGVITAVIGPGLLRGELDLDRPALGSAFCLALLIQPLLIRLWRKHRSEPDWILLPIEIRLHLLSLFLVLGILLISGYAAWRSSERAFEWVLFSGAFALPAATVSFFNRTVALRVRRDAGARGAHAHGGSRTARWLDVANHLEIAALVLAVLYTLTALVALAASCAGPLARAHPLGNRAIDTLARDMVRGHVAAQGDLPPRVGVLYPEICIRRLAPHRSLGKVPPIFQAMSNAKPYTLAVKAVIFDDQNRCLLLRRSAVNQHFVGCWEWPGGKLAPGEDFALGLKREVREEAGIEIELTGLAGASQLEMAAVSVVLLCMEARPLSTLARLSEEHDELDWVPLDRFRGLELAPGTGEFMVDYAQERLARIAGS